MKAGSSVKIDRVGEFFAAIDALAQNQVMIGVPAENDAREEGGSITNAEIGYLMENGIPEHNVPARPHLVPGVRDARKRSVEYMRRAGELAFAGRPDGVTRAMMAAGQNAVNAVKKRIRDGIPPPLAESTLKARARRGRKGAEKELKRRAANMSASVEFAKPLIDTAQYINSITFVIRAVKNAVRRRR